MRERSREQPPFRRPKPDEAALPARGPFLRARIGLRGALRGMDQPGRNPPSKLCRHGPGGDPHACAYEGPLGADSSRPPAAAALAEPGEAIQQAAAAAERERRRVTVTNPGKVFWPAQGYTKGDLVEYYVSIADWMLPYLKDRPVMLTRHPDGIDGKSFYQKDAPGFAPPWLRTEKDIFSRLPARYFIFHPG